MSSSSLYPSAVRATPAPWNSRPSEARHSSIFARFLTSFRHVRTILACSCLASASTSSSSESIFASLRRGLAATGSAAQRHLLARRVGLAESTFSRASMPTGSHIRSARRRLAICEAEIILPSPTAPAASGRHAARGARTRHVALLLRLHLEHHAQGDEGGLDVEELRRRPPSAS